MADFKTIIWRSAIFSQISRFLVEFSTKIYFHSLDFTLESLYLFESPLIAYAMAKKFDEPGFDDDGGGCVGFRSGIPQRVSAFVIV